MMSCCHAMITSMATSPREDSNFLATQDIEIATDQVRLYQLVMERTHATIYTKETLEFAIRTEMTNE